MATVKSMKDIIAQHPFFKGLSQEHIDLIAGCARNVRFRAGEIIFKEGDPADAFYLIREGRVAIEIHTPQEGAIRIQTLSDGDIFGWSWLIPPYRWRFSARAIEPTAALSMDGRCLRTKCDKDPALGYALLKRFSAVMVKRLELTRLQLLDLYAEPGQSGRVSVVEVKRTKNKKRNVRR